MPDKKVVIEVETPAPDTTIVEGGDTAALAANATATLAVAQAAAAQLESKEAIEEAQEDMEWLREQLTAQAEAIEQLKAGQLGLQSEISLRQGEIKEMLVALTSRKQEEQVENSPVNPAEKKLSAEGLSEAEKNQAEKPKSRILF